jgi:preprotein translocase SecE subunit
MESLTKIFMNPVAKYLQETRAELRHVAWPTQTQTIVYTVMVALLSVGVSLYLGFFDFMFTSTLTRVISALPSRNQIQVTQQPIQTQQTAPTTNTPTGGVQTTPLAPIKNGPSFNIIPGATVPTTPKAN